MIQTYPELTLRQLRRIASERGVEHWTRMNKDGLIVALAEQERARLAQRFAAAETVRISQVEFYQRLGSALSGVMQTAVEALSDQ